MDRLKNLFSQIVDLIKRGIKLFGDNEMSVYAGYTTLFMVTSLFPSIMLIIAIINLLPGYSVEDLMDLLFRLLPDLGPIRELLESVIMNLKDQSTGLLASVAAVTTLWSAGKGVSAMQKALNKLDKGQDAITENEESSGTKGKLTVTLKNILKRLLFTLLLIILLPAMLVFNMLGDSIANIISDVLNKLRPDGLQTTMAEVDSFIDISSLIVILLSLLVLLTIYARLPEKRRTLKSQLPGAILTGVCWLLFTKLFSLFIPHFFNASLYGSLASLFLLLLWLWVMIVIFFAGAVLNHVLEEKPQEDTVS